MGFRVPLSIEQKREVVKEVAALAGASSAVIVADYRGVNVRQFDEMRKAARDSGIRVRVVKNTLLSRSLAGTPFAPLSEKVVGSMVYVFVGENLGSSGRLIKKYSKDFDSFNVRWVAHEGKVAAGKEALDALASLPTREEALAQFLAVLKAPLTKLVGTLIEMPTRLLRALAAIKSRQEGD